MVTEQIKQVWEPTDTAKTLGHKLGRTRNSIIGYYMRNPELRLTHPLSGNPPRVRNKPGPRKNTPVDETARKERINARRQQWRASQRTEPLALDDDKTVGRYTLTTLPPNGCKWPYGHSGYFTFCGDDRQEGKQYCKCHVRLARAEWQPKGVKIDV